MERQIERHIERQEIPYLSAKYEALLKEMGKWSDFGLIDNWFPDCVSGEHNFQVIRFSSYRTASKLRFIQNKTNCKSNPLISCLNWIELNANSVHLIDLWNAIEAIRENGLHSFQDISSVISVSRLESLITSVFYSLSKRLPQSMSINLDQSIELLLSWLLMAYDS